MKNVIIKIKDQDYNLKYSIRALLLYERITGRGIQIDTLADQIQFFYCLLLASNPDMELTFDQFIDAIDNEEIDITQIQQFVIDQQKRQDELKNKTDKPNKKSSKKKS